MQLTGCATPSLTSVKRRPWAGDEQGCKFCAVTWWDRPQPVAEGQPAAWLGRRRCPRDVNNSRAGRDQQL